jgi:hypothetical protein
MLMEILAIRAKRELPASMQLWLVVPVVTAAQGPKVTRVWRGPWVAWVEQVTRHLPAAILIW